MPSKEHNKRRQPSPAVVIRQRNTRSTYNSRKTVLKSQEDEEEGRVKTRPKLTRANFSIYKSEEPSVIISANH